MRARVICHVFISLLLLCALGQGVGHADDNAGALKGGKFSIGIIVPLSGDLAQYGTAIRNGFELARRERPTKFGTIDFKFEDSKYEGKTAVSALQKLRATDGVDLYYLWGVSPTEAMLPIAAAYKLPVVAETTVKEATLNKPLVIRAARTGERLAQALDAQLKRGGVKSVSVITTQIPFYLDIVKYLVPLLTQRGVEVRQRIEVLPDERDFKSYLLGRGRFSDETFGVFLLPAQLITFFRQADEAKLPLHAFSADIMDSQNIIDQCPENINGTFYTQVGVTEEFRKSYTNAFNGDAQIGSAAQAFDFANLVGDLFGESKPKMDPATIIARIAAMEPRLGATGAFRYSDTVDSGKEIRMPVSMKIVEGKKIRVLAEDTGY